MPRKSDPMRFSRSHRRHGDKAPNRTQLKRVGGEFGFVTLDRADGLGAVLMEGFQRREFVKRGMDQARQFNDDLMEADPHSPRWGEAS